jgi:signal transduction histidine kinase/integral membrane sensor domain MASE1
MKGEFCNMPNFVEFSFQSIRMRILIFVTLCLTYFIVGNLSLEIATVHKYASPIWLATGLAVGSLTIFGRWLVFSVFIASTMVNLSAGMSNLQAIVVAFGNSIEAVAGSLLILYFLRRNFAKNYAEFTSILLSSTLCAILSSSIAIFIIYYDQNVPWSQISYAWYTWWSGDAIGIILLLPLFLEFSYRPREKTNFSFRKIILSLILCSIMIWAIYSVFVKNYNHAFAWSLGPFFIVLGLKLGRLYSRIILILVSFFVIGLTINGHGPFEQGDMNLNLLYVQSLLTTFACAVLFVQPLTTKYKISDKYLIGISFGWLSLFGIIYLTAHYEQSYTKNDFKKTSIIALDNLKNVRDQYKLLLAGSSSIFKIKSQLTHRDWKAYADSVQTEQIIQSVRGVGFLREVSNSQLEEFQKSHNLKVTYFEKDYAKNFNNHFIINHFEPPEIRERVIGLDLGSDETRRKAIEKAIKTRQMTATGPVEMYTKLKKGKGFLLLNPIWTDNDEFVGLTFSPMIGSIMFGRAFKKISHLLDIRISVQDETLYKTNRVFRGTKSSPYYYKKIHHIFGLDHLVEFYPTDLFFRRNSGQAAFLALVLNLFMLFISAFLLEQLTLGQRAEEIAENRLKDLEQSRAQLINSSKMASLGEMASGLAHEINNPLAIIQGKAKVISLMLEDLKVQDETIFKEVHKIKNTTDRIEKIVKGLRNFSRSSQNDPMEISPLKRIIQETLDLCAEKIRSEDINLQIQQIPDVHIKCRPGQISQVIINLLNNASDAIENQKDKWISIGFKTSGQILTLYFTDSGNGVNTEIADKIMEPFFTTKSVNKGTGLGLSITKSIIDSHGGHFWLDRNNTNTCFVVELPLV